MKWQVGSITMTIIEAIGATAPYVVMICGYIFLICKFCKDKIKMRERIKNLEVENIILIWKLNQYSLTRRHFNTRPEYSDDFIDAIKFAMTQAHPDNPNGDKDRFIRYRKLYEHLKG